MHKLATAIAVIATMMVLASCDETMVTEGTPAAAAPAALDGGSATRLQSLGFKAAATDASGQVVAMSYNGPVSAAVVCRQGSGGYAPIPPRQATLDSYVILSGGRVTSGLYALTQRNSSGQVEGIDFNLGQSKAFSTGLVCKAS